jgi:hypothetical protein
VRVGKVAAVAVLMVVAGLMARVTPADEADQAIRVKFSGAVQIPGQVLPAGTYWFVIVDERNPQIVQVLNADRTKSYGILSTIATERASQSSDVTVTLAKRGATEPEAVLAYFYPGHTIGHEFVYSKQLQKELAKAEHETQVSGN